MAVISALRIALATADALITTESEPPVAVVMSVAWLERPLLGQPAYPPVLGASRPGSAAPLTIEVASTAMPLGWIGRVTDARSEITVARVMLKPPPQTAAQIGSWPGASPNQTMNFMAPGRHPATAGFAT